MNKDTKKKVLNIILFIVSTIIILGILLGLISWVYSFNNNYRDYEFKFSSNAISIPLGQTAAVPIVSANGGSVNIRDYTYTSSDNAIVMVNEEGKITANKVGSTVVVVKAKKSNQKELLNVNVVIKGEGIAIQDINIGINDLNLKVGDKYTVNYEIIPNGALADNLVWSTSNSGVATVDKGIITAKKTGNCIIYVKDGTINKEIKVKVTN